MLPGLLRTLSIRTQLIGLALLVALLALAITGGVLFSVERVQQKEEIFSELGSISMLLANRSSAALAFFDEKTAGENLAALRTLPSIGQACMFDAEAKVFSAYARTGISGACTPFIPLDKTHRAIAGDIMAIQVPIRTGDALSGALLIRTLPAPWSERQAAQSRSLLLALGGALLMALLPALFLASTVSSPIVRMRETTRKIIESTDFSLRAPELGRNELGDLAKAFNAMLATIEAQNQELEARVSQRTAELASANEALREALSTLKQTQHVLIQQEKLASLGFLVAGIAHELNTPLGNSVLIASTIGDDFSAMRRQLAGNSLSRSAMEKTLDDCETAARLLMRNIEHAADLIGKFKEVAVDQASDLRRHYDLAKVINEVVDTLRPQFKRSPIRLMLDLAPDIRMDGYPGSLGQILTNLILNAKLHAFEGRESGSIWVQMQRRDERSVCLIVRDDGVGIQPENLGRIFDPFFTTRFGRGGSGLGLSIVYTLVTGRLGGYIEVQSQSGEGCCFTMTLPCEAPLPLVEPGL